MDHIIIYEIIGDGAGLSVDDAQDRLAAVQPTGAVTSDLAPPERKEPDSMRRCPMAPLGRGHWMEVGTPSTPSAHPRVQCRSDEVMALAN